MNISKVMERASALIRALENRLTVQKQATRDTDGQRELEAEIELCGVHREALKIISDVYAPHIQESLTLGELGRKHRITVEVFMPATESSFEYWRALSSHVFEPHSKEFEDKRDRARI